MISTAAWKSLRKKRSGLSTVLTALTALTLLNPGEPNTTFLLLPLPAGSPIAVETIGNWYWIVDEMRDAGHEPRLAHARKAKLMMGEIDKTDKLDSRGLATLLRTGTLPP